MTDSQDPKGHTVEEPKAVTSHGVVQLDDVVYEAADEPAPAPTSGENPVVVTVTQTTTFTEGGEDTVREDIVSQKTAVETDNTQEDDFMADLASM
ncbi:hypothetical protein EIP86_002910 [Pleurotus ostreatoroseus]|nr:hypothetical protein EIP86_002910 [Pleurotus ostreatoroseus]